MIKARQPGDLQVWWIPQIGMGQTFEVDVATVAEGAKILTVLANYDLFQFDHHVKPDYCNAGGLRRWCADGGDGEPDWEDWYDEDTGDDNPHAYSEAK